MLENVVGSNSHPQKHEVLPQPLVDVILRAMEPLTKLTVEMATEAQAVRSLMLLPVSVCCNCGSVEEVTLVTTPLAVAGLVSERPIVMPLPHCPRCLQTARRLPPRLGRTLAWFPPFLFLAAALVSGALRLFGARFDDHVGAALLAMTVVAVAGPLMVFRWRPPEHQGQTSRYQAVRVTPKRSFLGKTVAIQFSFTSSEYARLYREALKPND